MDWGTCADRRRPLCRAGGARLRRLRAGPPLLRIPILFFPAFRGLWTETKLWGPHVVRKWERKAWLSLDYGIEGVYCGLIKLASHAVYGLEDDVTYASIENAPEPGWAGIPAAPAIVPADWTFQLPVGELLFSSERLTNRLSKRGSPVAGCGSWRHRRRVARRAHFRLLSTGSAQIICAKTHARCHLVKVLLASRVNHSKASVGNPGPH